VLRFRPRSKVETAQELAAELAERTDADLDRGFTGHGPHRDDLLLERDGRELRSFGSQGEQRLGLLALLLAEREALADARGQVPLLLLDDVMSELDPDRRERLAVRVARHGQSVVTTTDLAFVPEVADAPVTRVRVADGQLWPEGAERAEDAGAGAAAAAEAA
jgi:DNA replication and repair protein RecF